jgi:hypothetical protein
MPTTFQDDLETINVSKLRAGGAITADATRVAVSFGQGDDAHRPELRAVHRKFPNGGGRSFFVGPVCRRPRVFLGCTTGRCVGNAPS